MPKYGGFSMTQQLPKELTDLKFDDSMLNKVTNKVSGTSVNDSKKDLEIVKKQIKNTLDYGVEGINKIKDDLDRMATMPGGRSKKKRSKKKRSKKKHSSNTRKRGKRMGRQSGGVIINTKEYPSSYRALSTFINECKKDGGKITLLKSNSIAGRMAILELPPLSDINIYTSYSATTFTKPVTGDIRKIIIKFCLLSEDLEDNKKVTMVGEGRGIEVVPPSTFVNESALQQQISLLTVNNDTIGRFQKATPYIVYSSIFDSFDDDNSKDVVDLLLEPNSDPVVENEWKHFRAYLEQGFTTGIKHRRSYQLDSVIPEHIKLKIGVIAMTMASSNEDNIVKGPGIMKFGIDAVTLSISQKNDIKSSYTISVVYELIRVAILCQRIHKDLHGGNYFVERIPDTLDIGRRVAKLDDETVQDFEINKYINYSEFWQFKATLIDWGRSIPMPLSESFTPEQLFNTWTFVGESGSLKASTNFFMYLLNVIMVVVTNGNKNNWMYHNTANTIVEAANAVSSPSTTSMATIDEKLLLLAKKIAQYHRLCYKATVDNVARVTEIWKTPKPFTLYDYTKNFSENSGFFHDRLTERLNKPTGYDKLLKVKEEQDLQDVLRLGDDPSVHSALTALGEVPMGQVVSAADGPVPMGQVVSAEVPMGQAIPWEGSDVRTGILIDGGRRNRKSKKRKSKKRKSSKLYKII